MGQFEDDWAFALLENVNVSKDFVKENMMDKAFMVAIIYKYPDTPSDLSVCTILHSNRFAI